jgi:hypothetical protein
MYFVHQSIIHQTLSCLVSMKKLETNKLLSIHNFKKCDHVYMQNCQK